MNISTTSRAFDLATTSTCAHDSIFGRTNTIFDKLYFKNNDLILCLSEYLEQTDIKKNFDQQKTVSLTVPQCTEWDAILVLF